MKESPTGVYLRIFLIGVVVALLGLAPIPHTVNADLLIARRSIASGDFLEASSHLAGAGFYFPWRYELNINAGRYALEAGDYSSAIQYFERPGALSHLTYTDKVLLGDAYLGSGNALVAEALWKHLTMQADSPEVHERLLKLYQERKDYVSVISQLQALLELNPSRTELYYQIGSLLSAIEPFKALPYLAQAAELETVDAANARLLHDKIRTANLFDDPAYTYLIAGRQLANTGDWELAALAFQHAIDIQPGYADAWAFLGEARGQLAGFMPGSISAAGLYELNKALQLDPNSILANTFMGLHWERQLDYKLAQIYIERTIQLDPTDPFLISELANLLSKSGDLPEAQSVYEAAIQINPQDPLFYRLLAEFALQNQIQIREVALPAARHAVSLAPQDSASLDLFAQVMLALQDYHTAERYLLNALKNDPGYAPAYLHIGTVYLYLGESAQARQWLSQAQTTQPESWINDQAKRMLEYYFP